MNQTSEKGAALPAEKRNYFPMRVTDADVHGAVSVPDRVSCVPAMQSIGTNLAVREVNKIYYDK